jgi:putative ABC transport system permease protein
VVSLSIAVAMLISVAIMVASFRDTVVVWIDRTLEGDLYVRPAASGGDGGRNVLAPEALPVLAAIPEIEAIDRFRAIGIDYDGFPAVVAGAELETVAAYSRLMFMGSRQTPEIARRLIGADRVVVSEPFAVRHHVQPGDTLMLPVPDGLREFEIEAVFYDYSSEGGLVVMDRSTWVSRFQDEGVSNVALYLTPGADANGVRAAIAAGLPETPLRIATNGELRTQVLRIFDQTFEVTYALEVIALAVAMLGIANTLAALIIERQPELAMLRFVGAARAQIRRVIMLESALIGVLGGAIGLALGVTLSLLLIHVISFQSFGWTIQFALPTGFLIQSLAIVLAATMLAGLYPASLALKTDPIKGIRAD